MSRPGAVSKGVIALLYIKFNCGRVTAYTRLFIVQHSIKVLKQANSIYQCKSVFNPFVIRNVMYTHCMS